MNILDNVEKRSFKINIIISLISLVIIFILSILKLISYWCLLSLTLGVIVSMVAYYHTAKTIQFTNYLYLKKTTTRLFAIRMLAYSLVMIIAYLLTKEPWSIIIATIGIVELKLSLYIANVKRKNNE